MISGREEKWFAWYPVRARVRLSVHARCVIYSRHQTKKWVWLAEVICRWEDGRSRIYVDCRLPFRDAWWIDRHG
jgi:hypothetical protein